MKTIYDSHHESSQISFPRELFHKDRKLQKQIYFSIFYVVFIFGQLLSFVRCNLKCVLEECLSPITAIFRGTRFDKKIFSRDSEKSRVNDPKERECSCHDIDVGSISGLKFRHSGSPYENGRSSLSPSRQPVARRINRQGRKTVDQRDRHRSTMSN